MRALVPLLLLVASHVAADPAENLDREAISEGVGKVKDKIHACGNGSSKGTVKVAVDVAPNGSVTAATIKQTPDKALGDCVAGVMKAATFRQTLKGGAFTYPFVFTPDVEEETLDRSAISDGIAKVKPQIMTCGTNSKAKGTVKVKVEVAGAGNVTTVLVTATPEESLGACVAGAIQKAMFKKTTKGGSFSYPFVF